MESISHWILGTPKYGFHLVMESGNGGTAGQQVHQLSPSSLLTQPVKVRCGGGTSLLTVQESPWG